MLSIFFWGLAAAFGLVYLNRYAFKSEVRRLETEDEISWRRAIEINPDNSGAHARLAEAAYKRGELESAIDSWRTAIRTSPHGPFAETWKRALKRALNDQERQGRGESINYADYRACPNCQKEVSVRAKTCPHCGETLYLSPVEFLYQPDVARSWARETLIATIVCLCLGVIFMNLPMEWKGAILMSTVIVGAWYFLKSFDGHA